VTTLNIYVIHKFLSSITYALPRMSSGVARGTDPDSNQKGWQKWGDNGNNGGDNGGIRHLTT